MPNILAPDKSKLSKRHGATSTLSYREQGYVPDAMLNFLALLGWSLDDRTDLIPREDLKRQFSLERVSRSPAVFQTDKLDWMNGQYIKTMEHPGLARALLEFWRLHPPGEIEGLPEVELLTQIAPLISERLKSLRDAAPLTAFFFSDEAVYEASELVQKGMDTESTKTALNASLRALDSLQSFDSPSIEHTLRALADELGLKVRQLLEVPAGRGHRPARSSAAVRDNRDPGAATARFPPSEPPPEASNRERGLRLRRMFNPKLSAARTLSDSTPCRKSSTCATPLKFPASFVGGRGVLAHTWGNVPSSRNCSPHSSLMCPLPLSATRSGRKQV